MTCRVGLHLIIAELEWHIWVVTSPFPFRPPDPRMNVGVILVCTSRNAQKFPFTKAPVPGKSAGGSLLLVLFLILFFLLVLILFLILVLLRCTFLPLVFGPHSGSPALGFEKGLGASLFISPYHVAVMVCAPGFVQAILIRGEKLFTLGVLAPRTLFFREELDPLPVLHAQLFLTDHHHRLFDRVRVLFVQGEGAWGGVLLIEAGFICSAFRVKHFPRPHTLHLDLPFDWLGDLHFRQIGLIHTLLEVARKCREAQLPLCVHNRLLCGSFRSGSF